MNSLREKLDAIIRQGTEAAQVELYHWEISRGGARTKLVVYIDTPTGVTLKDCERASRAIEALLDAQDPLAGPYVLEVSSPGIERRLWERSHYERAKGKRVKVMLRVPKAGRNVLTGRLISVSDQGITLEVDGHLAAVGFPEITRAQVVYEPGWEGG